MDQGRQHQEAEERTRSICEARLAEVHKEAAALRAKVDKLEAQSVKVCGVCVGCTNWITRGDRMYIYPCKQ